MNSRSQIGRTADERREPLFSGHRAHDELVEKALIGRARTSYGIPLFPQAMIYVVFLSALVIMLASLLSGS
jgi:hypothetical protein